MRRVLMLSATMIAGCPMSTPADPADAGTLRDAGLANDAGASPVDSGPAPVQNCDQALPAPPEGQDCLVEGTGESRLIGGELLLDDHVLSNGWVLINASGEIACVNTSAKKSGKVTILISMMSNDMPANITAIKGTSTLV